MEKRNINFTKATLAALPVPAPGKRAYYQDFKSRGLMLAITDRGTRSFVFYRKIDGRPERILIGRIDEVSIEQARNRASELNSQIASGQNPANGRRAVRAEMTLEELFHEFMERHAKINVKYHHQYEAQFRMYFRDGAKGCRALATTRVSKISRPDLTAVHDRITRNKQPITANRVLSMISSVFSWAVRAGLAEGNPAIGIRKNNESSHQRDRFLQAEEMPRFFQSLVAHPNEVMRDYVLLSLLTGQRQANILAMEWTEIDFTNSTWRIPRSKTKTRREYVVPLVPEVLNILQRRRESLATFSRYVLPGNGKSGHLSHPNSDWKQILARAELYGLMNIIAERDNWPVTTLANEHIICELTMSESINRYRELVRARNVDPDQFSLGDLRMHDLRRTLASWQAITGANLVAISKTLNHSNVATTSIYARLQLDPVRQAIQTAAGAMLSAAGMVEVTPVISIRKKVSAPKVA